MQIYMETLSSLITIFLDGVPALVLKTSRSRVGKIGCVVVCFVDLGSLALWNIFVFK